MRLYDNDAYREEFMELVYELLHDDGTNDRANQIIAAFDSAPEVEAEPLQPNAPLTLEELRGMEGQPVWLEADKGGRYAVISFVSKHFVEFTDGAQPSISMYGKSWLAYSRKPEEAS